MLEGDKQKKVEERVKRIRSGGWKQAGALVSSSGYRRALWRAELSGRAMAYAEAKGKLDWCAGQGGQCGWSGASQGRW